MSLDDYISPVHLLELLAAIAGTFYLRKTKDDSVVRLFVWFLWLTFIVEITGLYAAVAYFSNYEVFSFTEGTPFSRNYWLYNIYSILAFSMYIYFFASILKNKVRRNWLLRILILFDIIAVLNLIISDVFFVAHSVFTFFVGTLIVIAGIAFYYFELLNSNKILEIKRSVPFYISVGALVYHLGLVPLVIYSGYFNNKSPEFVRVYTIAILSINYFLYSLYIFGFLICSRKKNFS